MILFHGEPSSIPYFIGMSQYDTVSFSYVWVEHCTAGQVISELVPCISKYAAWESKVSASSPYRSVGGPADHTQSKHSWGLPTCKSPSLWQCHLFQQCVQELSMMVLRSTCSTSSWFSVLTIKIASSVDAMLMSYVYKWCISEEEGVRTFGLAASIVRAGTADGKQWILWYLLLLFFCTCHKAAPSCGISILQFGTCLCITFQHAKWDKISALMTLDPESLPLLFFAMSLGAK